MFNFYTAIRHLHLIKNESGYKYPIVKLNERTLQLNQNELIIWSNLIWHITDYDELFSVFKIKILEETSDEDMSFIKDEFNKALNQLLDKNIVVVSDGETGVVAIYNLLINLKIVSSTASFGTTLLAFFKFVFIDHLPFIKLKKFF